MLFVSNLLFHSDQTGTSVLTHTFQQFALYMPAISELSSDLTEPLLTYLSLYHLDQFNRHETVTQSYESDLKVRYFSLPSWQWLVCQ